MKRTIDKTANADFVANAKILKVTLNENNNRIHNIEIGIIDLYKGSEIKSLEIYSKLGSSCSFFTPENTTWLIFARKGKSGKLGFGLCSGSRQIDREFDLEKDLNSKTNYDKSIELELELLDYLKKIKINPVNEYNLFTGFSNVSIKEFDGIELKNDKFSIHELTVNIDLSIDKIKVLKEFNNPSLQSDLLNCIKESLKIHKFDKKSELIDKTKLIVVLYYYPEGKTHKSFIRQ
ncbi:MAG: hypothetical protein ACPG41_07140 [Lacinutrix venerupis]